MIDSYRFGSISVAGKAFTADLIILPDRILKNWRRTEGHRLSLDDLGEVFKEKPDALVIGTGAMGMLKIDTEVLSVLREQGIEFFSGKTKKAIQIFNEWTLRKKTAGVFHITC